MMRAHVFTHEPEAGKFRPRIEFDVPAEASDSDVVAITWIGKELNRGDGRVGQLYRSHGFPPLGAGDLLVLDRERWWICEATGWKRTERPESVPDEKRNDAEEGVYKVKRG